MKYCEKCNVGIHKDLITCPLCGKHAEETRENYFTEYEQKIEQKVQCARTMPVPSGGKFLSRLFFTLLILVILISVIMNLLYSPHIWVAHFIIFGALLAYIDIFHPIAKGKKLHNRVIINIAVISIFLMTIDLLQPGGWRGFTFTYGMPIIALVSLAVVDFMIILRRKKIREYFVNLYFVTIYSLIPRIILWANSSYEPQILAAIVFFGSIINGIIMSVIFYPWIIEEFQRKFFID